MKQNATRFFDSNSLVPVTTGITFQFNQTVLTQFLVVSIAEQILKTLSQLDSKSGRIDQPEIAA